MGDGPALMTFEASMEPYAQLVRSLLPRAASVSLFDSTGKLLWSSATRAPIRTCSRSCCRRSRSSKTARTSATASASTARCPTTGPPIYSGCATRAAAWPRSWPWSATGSRSKPTCCRSPTCTSSSGPRSSCCAATCWRAPTSTLLNESLTARDKDLELLLSVTGSHPQASGSDDLQSLLANAAGHLKCVLAGIVVPDKGLVLTHPDSRRQQHPHAHAAPAARDHADAPRSAGDQPDRDAGRPGRDSVSHPRLPAAPGIRPHLGRARAVPQARGAGVRRPRRAPRRPASRARSRPASKPATTRCPAC